MITDEFSSFDDPQALLARSFYRIHPSDSDDLAQTIVMQAFDALGLTPGDAAWNRAFVLATMLAKTNACAGSTPATVRQRLERALTKGTDSNRHLMLLLRCGEWSAGDATEPGKLLRDAEERLAKAFPGFQLKVDLLKLIMPKIVLGRQTNVGVCFAAVVATLLSSKQALSLLPARLLDTLRKWAATLTSIVSSEDAGVSRDGTALSNALYRLFESLPELYNLSDCDLLDGQLRSELAVCVKAVDEFLHGPPDDLKTPGWYLDELPAADTGGRQHYLELSRVLSRLIESVATFDFDAIVIKMIHPIAALAAQTRLLEKQMFIEAGGHWIDIMNAVTPDWRILAVGEMLSLINQAGKTPLNVASQVRMLSKLESFGPFVCRYDMRRDFWRNFDVLVLEPDRSPFVTMMGEESNIPCGHVVVITGAGPASVQFAGDAAARDTIIFQLTNTQDGRQIQYVSLELLQSLNAGVEYVIDRIFSVPRTGEEQSFCSHIYQTMAFGPSVPPHDVEPCQSGVG